MGARAPNILFLMSDQMGAPVLPIHGHPVCQARHIEALADSGVVFDSAYCNYPLCAPARFSMLAGRLAPSIGAFDNASEFTADTPTLAHYLSLLGYPHRLRAGAVAGGQFPPVAAALPRQSGHLRPQRDLLDLPVPDGVGGGADHPPAEEASRDGVRRRAGTFRHGRGVRAGRCRTRHCPPPVLSPVPARSALLRVG